MAYYKIDSVQDDKNIYRHHKHGVYFICQPLLKKYIVLVFFFFRTSLIMKK
ncbi:CPXV224 protein [Cowpox virus]|uniref:CPXV007 protein n=2 Tax=Cowpox virus TaxID=10243 RepID=A0A5C1IZR0_COWPX|nr:CPXV007 protein [Cowpox virus]NP_851593.1 CPXV224 protein [Cowpox virus]AAM13453.2 CPXV007 protein [Cowpox virus]AAP41063.1 CPXV224 protein [Cowpox virus]QEM24881.1 CPXV224 protein [Cowpox virus]QEM25150.1 CPXV224 protein [Cowpox virus]QEM25156.1 CPXV007 protein [Cowpox virus]